MLLNHIGCKRKKKGITLIELIISMSIDLIILFICFNVITINYNNFKVLINYDTVNSSLDDAILNINILLKTKMIENIEIRDDTNIIIIKYRNSHSKENIKVKEISLNGGKIEIKTSDDNVGNKGFNPILMEVATFDIVKKGKIYYLKIKMINGEQRIVCL